MLKMIVVHLKNRWHMNSLLCSGKSKKLRSNKNYFVKVFYIDLFVKIWFDGNLLTTLFGQNFRENDVFTKEITE